MIAISELLRAGVTLIALVGLVSESSGQDNMRPRNVILIVADDLGATDLGCYGSKFHRTPALDALATRGVQFTQAYAACPVCSPTRAALLTGKYPARLHITDWLPGRGDRPDQRLNRPSIRQELPLAEVTLAEKFRDAGYVTGHIGKWHLGGQGSSPLEHGFQVNIAGDEKGSPLSYFAPYARGGRTMPGLEHAEPGEYLTDRLTSEALSFLETHQKQPFFLYLPHFAVHTPMNGKEELIEKFPAEAAFAGQQNNPIYAAMLASLDEGVGRIVDKLEALQLTQQTLIVFTSDNGGLATTEGPRTPATSNAPFREGKGWLYEGGVRVPLIFAGAGIAGAGRKSPQVVSSQDLLPTLCELTGLPPTPELDGVSFATSLKTVDHAAKPRTLFWHYPHYSNQGGRPGGAVRHGDQKLIEYFESGRRELFDLSKDPRESKNLSAELPDVVERLSAELRAWRESVGAQEMSPNPKYVPNPQAANGRVVLPARTAQVEGVMLRYEPMPHKNTLGFWVRPEDQATWEFQIVRPGRFQVEALVGCGTGSGGSQVEFQFGSQILKLEVPETGGFQKFVPQSLGQVEFKEPGRYALRVAPQSKPGPAVMDLQQVVLIPEP